MLSQWIARGMFVYLSVVTVLSAITSVTATLVFVPKFGIIAAAWVAVAAYLVVALGNLGMIAHCEYAMRSHDRIAAASSCGDQTLSAGNDPY